MYMRTCVRVYVCADYIIDADSTKPKRGRERKNLFTNPLSAASTTDDLIHLCFLYASRIILYRPEGKKKEKQIYIYAFL